MKKKLLIFYPFLLAVYPVLFLYSHNINELGHQLFWLTVMAGGALALAAVFYFVLCKITVNKIKAGVYSSAFIIFFFSYEYFRNILNKANKVMQVGFFEHQYAVFLCVWVLVFIALFYFIKNRI